MLPIKFMQFMDPIQFPFPPHNDGFEDAPRSERPVVENCDKIAELIERDRHSSSRSIGQDLGMSHQTVINHLKKIGFKKKLDEWVPHDAKKHFFPYGCMRIASVSQQNRPIFEADSD